MYKPIPNYPGYFINDDGTIVLKLCDQRYFKPINGLPYKRKCRNKTYNALPEDKYLILDGCVYLMMKISLVNDYYAAKLTNECGRRNQYIHRLVYQAFVGPIAPGKEVNHIDHDKWNNSVTNLELVSHSENLMKSVVFHGNQLKPRCSICARVIYRKDVDICITCAKTNPEQSRPTLSQKQLDWHVKNRKVEWPTKEQLWDLIQTTSFLEIGRRFGVTDTAVRKWCRKYGLPYKQSDLKNKSG